MARSRGRRPLRKGEALEFAGPHTRDNSTAAFLRDGETDGNGGGGGEERGRSRLDVRPRHQSGGRSSRGQSRSQGSQEPRTPTSKRNKKFGKSWRGRQEPSGGDLLGGERQDLASLDRALAGVAGDMRRTKAAIREAKKRKVSKASLERSLRGMEGRRNRLTEKREKFFPSSSSAPASTTTPPSPTPLATKDPRNFPVPEDLDLSGPSRGWDFPNIQKALDIVGFASDEMVTVHDARRRWALALSEKLAARTEQLRTQDYSPRQRSRSRSRSVTPMGDDGVDSQGSSEGSVNPGVDGSEASDDGLLHPEQPACVDSPAPGQVRTVKELTEEVNSQFSGVKEAGRRTMWKERELRRLACVSEQYAKSCALVSQAVAGVLSDSSQSLISCSQSPRVTECIRRLVAWYSMGVVARDVLMEPGQDGIRKTLKRGNLSRFYSLYSQICPSPRTPGEQMPDDSTSIVTLDPFWKFLEGFTGSG